MFDSVCKFLVESFSSDFATWLLAETTQLTELSPSELSLEPIRADALILLQSDEVVLHLEFQTKPKPDIPFRMLDYRIRVYRRFPDKRMRQVVIYLYPSTSELVQQTTFTVENTYHEFEVIRLWEQSTDIFLQTPGLLPLAVLTQTRNKTQVLQQVAQKIEEIPEQQSQSNLTGSTFVLAGLVLEKEVITRILRRDVMQESVTYQLIKEETQEEERQRIVLNLLKEGISIDIISRVTGVSIEQIQQIQENQEQN